MEAFTLQLVLRLEWLAEHLQRWMSDHLINIVVILIGAWLFRRVANDLIHRLLAHIVRPTVYPTKSDREKRIQTLGSLLRGLVRIGVYIVATLLIIGELYPGARTTLFTSAGVLGAIIGFGAQSLIKDLMTGIFIISENQYRIGDEVTLVAGMGLGQTKGRVEDITIRTTVLRDLSGNVHHIPNGNIGVTTNKTLGYSKMNEELVVHFDTDMQKLERVIKKVGEDLKKLPQMQSRIIEAPHFAGIKGYTDKGIAIRIIAKTNAAAQWHTRSEFYLLLQKAFDKNDIKVVGQTEEDKK